MEVWANQQPKAMEAFSMPFPNASVYPIVAKSDTI